MPLSAKLSVLQQTRHLGQLGQLSEFEALEAIGSKDSRVTTETCCVTTGTAKPAWGACCSREAVEAIVSKAIACDLEGNTTPPAQPAK